MRKRIAATALCINLLFGITTVAGAEHLRIVIMQDIQGEAHKYAPLIEYFETKGIHISFTGAPNYPAAAKLFAAGDVDGMFSGSAVAGIMMIKNVAVPVARPVDAEGHSTYRAVILAPKGSPRFTGGADYFRDKKIMCAALASSGEFFFRSLPGSSSVQAKIMKAASHGAAVEGLSKGIADVAIVKNLVWEKLKAKYPDLLSVGEDHGENPDGTLIMSTKTSPALVRKVESALLGIKTDPSGQAGLVREKMGIQGYLKTTADDFKHTLELLVNAGVTESFEFSF